MFILMNIVTLLFSLFYFIVAGVYGKFVNPVTKKEILGSFEIQICFWRLKNIKSTIGPTKLLKACSKLLNCITFCIFCMGAGIKIFVGIDPNLEDFFK